MKQLMAMCVAAVFIMSFCTIVGAAEQMQRSKVVSARATIVAIDQDNRVVTLKGPQGNTFDVKVGEDVQNFSELKPGDMVNVKYRESLLVQMAKPGQKPMASMSRSVEKAEPGAEPGGVVTDQINITATVTNMDKRKGELTLKGPEGNMVTFKNVNPANLQSLKVGDQLDITYTQALAMSIEKARA
jgi:NAD(P)H-flavin reductase